MSPRARPTADLRGRMGAAATRKPTPPLSTAAEPTEAPPAAAVAPRVSPYKGTFEMSRPDAKRLRLAAMEHDTSVTRLVQAAAIAALDDPEVMAAALRVVERLARDRA